MLWRRTTSPQSVVVSQFEKCQSVSRAADGLTMRRWLAPDDPPVHAPAAGAPCQPPGRAVVAALADGHRHPAAPTLLPFDKHIYYSSRE